MEIITNRYRKETGLSAYKFNWFGKRIHNQEYINWLEKQCTIKGVVKSLKDKESFTFDEYLKFFYKYTRQYKYINKETQVLMSLEEIEQRYDWHIKTL